MARALSLPELLVSDLGRKYPALWRKLDQIRFACAGKDASWPGQVFAPIHIWARQYADLVGAFTSHDQFSELFRLANAAAWRPAQDIVSFDPTVYEAITETPLTGTIPTEILWRLPAWGVYFESPGLRLKNSVWDGFIASLDMMAEGQKLLNLFFMAPGKDLEFCFELGEKPFNETLTNTVSKNQVFWNVRNPAEAATNGLDLKEGITSALNLVLYVCSYGFDDILRHASASACYPAGKKVKTGWRLFPPDKPHFHRLGAEQGEKIRAYAASANTGKHHASPRPHVRRAHWHGFWTGPRKTEGKRQLLAKWLPPIGVGLGEDESVYR